MMYFDCYRNCLITLNKPINILEIVNYNSNEILKTSQMYLIECLKSLRFAIFVRIILRHVLIYFTCI